MRVGRLGRLVGRNVARAKGSFLLSTFGIAIGVAAFAFLLGLAGGVSRVLLGQVFPADRLEVVPPRTSLNPLSLLMGQARLTDEAVAKLRARPEVRSAYPKMKLAFPARAWGGEQFFGRPLQTEFIGDGIPPRLVDRSVLGPYEFRDLDADGGGAACTADADCPKGWYCPADLGRCHQPVPALVSRYLVEIYNSQVAHAHGLPAIGELLVGRLRGFTFQVELGRSLISRSPRGRPVVRRLRLVGISDQAVPVGLTVPLPYVKRWNRTYGGEQDAARYTSVVVKVRSQEDLTGLVAYIKELGFEQGDRHAEQAGLAITVLTALFVLLATVIIAVAAVSIAHSFFAAILKRRRELGLLRAIGASKRDVALLVLGEAVAVGLAGAVTGLLLAWGASLGADLLAARLLPSFPFKPESFFAFGPGLILGSFGFALGFAVVGAVLPALRAATLDPARSLSGP